MEIPDDLSGPRQADWEALCDRFGEENVRREIMGLVEGHLSDLWNNREAVEDRLEG